VIRPWRPLADPGKTFAEHPLWDARVVDGKGNTESEDPNALMTALQPSTTKQDWNGIIARARKLEPEAFDEIVDTYAGRLCGFFHRALGNKEEAEDLTQEVFVRVVRNIESYTESGRFEAWLFRIAANLVRDRIRSEKRSPTIVETGDDDVDSVDGGGGYRMCHNARPGQAMESEEESTRLQHAIDQLPEGERKVILLRHYGGLSFADIAEYMGTPIGTALARAHRGLAKLRTSMEQTRDG